jgi:hypothetical protein
LLNKFSVPIQTLGTFKDEQSEFEIVNTMKQKMPEVVDVADELISAINKNVILSVCTIIKRRRKLRCIYDS